MYQKLLRLEGEKLIESENLKDISPDDIKWNENNVFDEYIKALKDDSKNRRMPML